jgi:glycerol-3-phosphate cytidylyltransferase
MAQRNAAARGRVVVFTSGTFDLFHLGHVNLLRRSKALGDYLIVAVSTDELIASYKGVAPIIPFRDRMRMVASCRYVDKVVKQTVLTDVRQLKRYKVNIVTLGSDWRDKYLEGIEWMKTHGKVVFLPYTQGVSTTSIKRDVISRIYEVVYADAKRAIDAQIEKESRMEARWPRTNNGS